jgi:hypothetical protein
MTPKRLFAALLAAAATLVITATPISAAAPTYPCDSIIFNACFYPEPAFRGPEYRTVIHSHGCYPLPPSRSYHLNITATAYAESGCTGHSTEISGYFGFDIGFSALSLRYPAE